MGNCDCINISVTGHLENLRKSEQSAKLDRVGIVAKRGLDHLVDYLTFLDLISDNGQFLTIFPGFSLSFSNALYSRPFARF